MHFRLFDRPLIVDGQLSTMYIDGIYEEYDPGSAYEGRVNIHGSVGMCRVEILESNLPPGAFAYVDNVFKQVVVKWPVYTPPVETFSLLENGDFSQGDTGSWTNTGEGTPFVIELDSDGQMSLKFKSGFGGGHYVESPLAPVKDINKQITLTGDIAQGKSSKRKMWGGVVLTWHDENRNVISWNEGSWVNSGGGYQESKVVAAPSDVRCKYVSARIHFDRKGQNHPAWADNIKWDHVWTKGYDSDETLYVIVKVTDALNNTATHRGEIDERGIWFTSRPLEMLVTEKYQTTADLYRFTTAGGVAPVESYAVESELYNFSMRAPLSEFSAPPELYLIQPSLLSAITMRAPRVDMDAGLEVYALTGKTMHTFTMTTTRRDMTAPTEVYALTGSTIKEITLV